MINNYSVHFGEIPILSEERGILNNRGDKKCTICIPMVSNIKDAQRPQLNSGTNSWLQYCKPINLI